LYKLTSKLLLRLRIDDPVDAFSVHAISGGWGVIAVGFFATQHQVVDTLARTGNVDWGIFVGGAGVLLGIQLLALLIVICWTIFWGVLAFGILKFVDSRLPTPIFYIRDEGTFEVCSFSFRIINYHH
jgi:Amt family ammonium transporter